MPLDLVAGTVVGNKYELVRRIGSGAMGEVWAARHETLHEEVAIKLVMRNVTHQDGTSAASRFHLEARISAALSRKTRHIVSVTDHGEDGALGYLVMELLAGESLDERVAAAGPLPVAEVAPMIMQIARGLSIAHADGVVHRDLKASNVFVTLDEDGNPLAKILDFGIAKQRSGLDRKAAHATQRGFLLGTPAYMSPEQARGKAIDPRADVWALAVIAYQMLTGALPFEGTTADELFARVCRIEPTPICERLPDAPAALHDFFARAFARRLEDRFQSALALAEALESLHSEMPPRFEPALEAPPPPVLPRGEAPDESLFVAGVPRRERLGPAVLAGLIVGAVFAVTGALVSLHFEREPAPSSAAGSSPRASVSEVVASAVPNAGHGPSAPSVDDVVSGTIASPAGVPPVARRAVGAVPLPGRAPPKADDVATVTAGSPSAAAPPPPQASTAPAPAPDAPQNVDRSEVF